MLDMLYLAILETMILAHGKKNSLYDKLMSLPFTKMMNQLVFVTDGILNFFQLVFWFRCSCFLLD